MAAFGRKHFLSDTGCKLLLFLHRVGRGVSIGSICILSVYQAITISPGNSRHKQQVQHIRRTNASSRSSHESRATKIILLLMSSFACFYTLSSIFQVVVAFFENPSWIIMNVTAFVSVCFPTVSPFLLMSHDSRVPRLCFAWTRNIKSPHPGRLGGSVH
ncbi:vomeronasal type-1 receptor 4-like [Panthera leo]|uniref:vomeronasal type-1 receptor 4-like n=1 Tax=Panthera leo TaxID=9689 RepID=UPI001C6A0834|nr:vomeronasal type-1 receptor 4-like [Panthera leo]